MGGAVLAHALVPMFAAVGAGRLTLRRRDVAVPVSVESGERRLAPGPGLGDHDRRTGLHALATTAAAPGSAMGAGGTRPLPGARLAVGVPDYDAYVAHQRRAHPDREPMSREAFARERMEARYGRGRSRCC